ncbi:MAG: sigma 54-interacting transcriptional regulator [Desulfotignum sp.]|nr:sigma 54-interacting transcriptional regulator [Desulfotignum sp.]MCF8126285.1 sigma 54-interacting transcriptional regulator [Desulfotignum sp.]
MNYWITGDDAGRSVKSSESFQKIRRQLGIVFETSSDGIWICDEKGKILALNQASERLNGVKAEEVIGKNVSIMIEKNIVDANITPDVIHTQQTISRMQYIKRTGRQLMLTGSPAFDTNGNLIMVVVNERDMTELNALQKELKKTRQEKEQIISQLKSFSAMHQNNFTVLAENPVMRRRFDTALKLAHHDVSNILVLGETGSGKGMMCNYIQQNSPRKDLAFITINCAALPENLLEAELFGYEKGAFTGAGEKGKPGLFELAHEGTLFLDEIGDMPMSIQSKLLKYLDDHEVLRLGGIRPKKINCRILAATNQNLDQLVKSKRFRQDLLHRINSFVLKIPPLRDRPEDILLLTNHFLAEYNARHSTRKKIGIDGLNALQAHPFSGNIRELKNIIQEAVIIGSQDLIDGFIMDKVKNHPQKLPETMETPEPGLRFSLQKKIDLFEKKLLSDAVSRCSSTPELARHLAISQPTAFRKMKKHRLAFRKQQ